MSAAIFEDEIDPQPESNSDAILIAAYLDKLNQLELGETL